MRAFLVSIVLLLPSLAVADLNALDSFKAQLDLRLHALPSTPEFKQLSKAAQNDIELLILLASYRNTSNWLVGHYFRTGTGFKELFKKNVDISSVADKDLVRRLTNTGGEPASPEEVFRTWISIKGYAQVCATLFKGADDVSDVCQPKLAPLPADIGTVPSNLAALLQHPIYKKFHERAVDKSAKNTLYWLRGQALNEVLQILKSKTIRSMSGRVAMEAVSRGFFGATIQPNQQYFALDRFFKHIYANILYAMWLADKLDFDPASFDTLTQYMNENIHFLLIRRFFSSNVVEEKIRRIFNEPYAQVAIGNGGLGAFFHISDRLEKHYGIKHEWSKNFFTAGPEEFSHRGTYFELNQDQGKKALPDKLRTLYIDRHISPDPTVATYPPIDIIRELNVYKNKGKVPEHVVVDTTFDTLDAPALGELKNRIHSEFPTIKLYFFKSSHKLELFGYDDRPAGVAIFFDEKEETSSKNSFVTQNPLTYQYFALSLLASYNRSRLAHNFRQTLIDTNLAVAGGGLSDHERFFVFRGRHVARILEAYGIPVIHRQSFAYMLPAVSEFPPHDHRLIPGALPEPYREQLIEAAAATSIGHYSFPIVPSFVEFLREKRERLFESRCTSKTPLLSEWLSYLVRTTHEALMTFEDNTQIDESIGKEKVTKLREENKLAWAGLERCKVKQ